jgi:chemotaxis signal transduction protein
MADGAATADPVRAEPIALDLAAFAAPASDSPERAFGLFRIGRAMVAIPVEAVREATPARPLSALPGGAPGLLGALTLRGDVIPVLDLRERLQLPHDDAAQAIIVVVRISGGRLLGFSADEVCGIARTRASEMTTLHVRDAGAEDETPHAFVAGERAVVALDVERIAAAPGTPLGQERAASSARAARAQAGSWLLFRAGDARFAVDSLQVEAALPRTTIERNALSSDYCLGVARLRDREVAVLCPQGALGVGPVCAPAAAEIVVVRLGGGALIGFAIDAVETIRRFEAADNLPLPALGGMRDGFFSGLLGPEQGEPALAIDPEALRRDPLIAGLAEVGQSTGGRGRRAPGGRGRRDRDRAATASGLLGRGPVRRADRRGARDRADAAGAGPSAVACAGPVGPVAPPRSCDGPVRLRRAGGAIPVRAAGPCADRRAAGQRPGGLRDRGSGVDRARRMALARRRAGWRGVRTDGPAAVGRTPADGRAG